MEVVMDVKRRRMFAINKRRVKLDLFDPPKQTHNIFEIGTIMAPEQRVNKTESDDLEGRWKDALEELRDGVQDALDAYEEIKTLIESVENDPQYQHWKTELVTAINDTERSAKEIIDALKKLL